MKIITKYLECIEDNNIFKKGDVAILIEDKGLVSLVKTTVNNNVIQLNVMTRFFKEVHESSHCIIDGKIIKAYTKEQAVAKDITKCKQNILNLTNSLYENTVEYNLNMLETLIKLQLQ